MTDFDYKKYSLENLENWLHDAISSSEATPDEVYDVIVKVIREEYYYHKHHASKAYELLSKLNGNGSWTIEDVMKEKEYYEPSMPPWGHSDLEYLCNQNSEEEKEKCSEYNLREAEYYDKRAKLDMNYQEAIAAGWTMTGDGFWIPPQKKDKVVKWQLPVEVDEPNGEYFVCFPDDLLEAANLKEGDQVEWIDQGNSSYLLQKV
jgi:hypothetical protein